MLVAGLVATLGMQAVQPGLQHAMPTTPGAPLSVYFGCLFDPLAGVTGKGLPAARSKREQIVRRILTHCAQLRTAAREEARQDAATDADKAEVERALLAVEGQLRFVVVQHEKAIATDAAFCRSRGEKLGC
jgi:hypothetical protein